MPSKKGRTKTGGRLKGTPNKDSLPVHKKAAELQVDPLVILLLFAKGDSEALKTLEAITNSQRLNAAGEACQYMYSKRKAVDLNVKGDIPEDECPDVSDEELDEL